MKNKDRIGYGQRIYKKKKSPLPYVFIILSLATSFFIFNHMRNKNQEEFREYSTKEALRLQLEEKTRLADESKEEIDDFNRDIEEPASEHHNSSDYTTHIPSSETGVSSTEQKENKNSTGKDKPTSSQEDQKIFQEAGESFALGDYKKALRLYLLLAPSNKKALVYVGMCYYWLKDYTNALDYFKKAIECDNMDFLAKKYMAFTYYDLDRLDEARHAVTEALGIMKDGELEELKSRLMEEKKVMDRYTDTTTTKFKILFSNTQHQDVERMILDHLNEAYRVVGRGLNFFPKTPVTVILYNEKDFFDVTRSPGWAGGLYDGKIRLPIRGMSSSSLLRRIIIHEYAHALIHNVTRYCPRWIDEGLAEYFSEESIPQIGQLIPLNLLEQGFPMDEELVAIAYRESYWAVKHLLERYGKYRVTELLKSFGRGNDIRKAFREVFMTPYENFLRDWGKD